MCIFSYRCFVAVVLTFYHLMYKFGRRGFLLWKAFLIFEQIVSVYTCSHITCSQIKMTACQADFMIHPYIVKSLLYFTCIQSIHSSTYTHATEWYVGSLTDIVCLAVSCVLYFLYSTCENSLLVEQKSPM